MTASATTEIWNGALARTAAHYGHVIDVRTVAQQMRWHEQLPLPRKLEQIVRLMGLHTSLCRWNRLRWSPGILPVLAAAHDGSVLVIEAIDEDQNLLYWRSDGGDLQRKIDKETLQSQIQDTLVLTGIAEHGRDARIDDFIKPYRKHWFWQHFAHAKRQIGEVALASIIGNVLALAGILFSMQVYDRVIPSQSMPTLWVLFGGVLLAAAIEYAIRLSRTVISDLMGKQIDLSVSGMLFARALAIKNEARPKSTGSFISQLREIDQVRELLTSTTVGAAADMPFVLLFLALMSFVGGPLVFIPMLAIPLIVIPGILLQWPMAKLAKDGMRESALRNAVLVESIEGVEDIKILQAEPYFQRQ